MASKPASELIFSEQRAVAIQFFDSREVWNSQIVSEFRVLDADCTDNADFFDRLFGFTSDF